MDDKYYTFLINEGPFFFSKRVSCIHQHAGFYPCCDSKPEVQQLANLRKPIQKGFEKFPVGATTKPAPSYSVWVFLLYVDYFKVII